MFPGVRPNLWQMQALGDLMFVGSFFVLGGNFWDKVHALFDQIVRSAPVLDILKKLLGPGLRLHGSKLNMKSAQYGSPVEWHQDWAFYPHTNDDIL